MHGFADAWGAGDDDVGGGSHFCGDGFGIRVED